MKYLQTQQIAHITIYQHRPVNFAVPVELATLVFWFLACQPARLIALSTWLVARDACLYVSGWLSDLELIWRAVCDWQGWRITLGELVYVGT